MNPMHVTVQLKEKTRVCLGDASAMLTRVATRLHHHRQQSVVLLCATQKLHGP